jgi:hypothetical protein
MNPQYCSCTTLCRLATTARSKVFLLTASFSLFQSKEDGYDPRKSKVSASTSEKWNSSAVTGILTEVPGIGPAAVAKLAFDELNRPHEQVTNTYQLFGVYLIMKGSDASTGETISSYEHNERFWQWLKTKGVVSHRSAIVKAIAEKCATYFANFYDANAYESDDDDEDEEEK